jgi:hypothetical protein
MVLMKEGRNLPEEKDGFSLAFQEKIHAAPLQISDVMFHSLVNLISARGGRSSFPYSGHLYREY